MSGLKKYYARKHGLFADDPYPDELRGAPTTVVYKAEDVAREIVPTLKRLQESHCCEYCSPPNYHDETCQGAQRVLAVLERGAP